MQGLALRQSKGQSKSGERCPGVISVSCTQLLNDPIAQGNLRGPDTQGDSISQRQRSGTAKQIVILSAFSSAFPVRYLC